MKKYVKPDVVFEGFELSQHIAGGCTAMLNFADINNCETNGKGGFNIEAGFFAQTNVDCVGEWTGWEDMCLYTNTTAIVFFKS